MYMIGVLEHVLFTIPVVETGMHMQGELTTAYHVTICALRIETSTGRSNLYQRTPVSFPACHARQNMCVSNRDVCRPL